MTTTPLNTVPPAPRRAPRDFLLNLSFFLLILPFLVALLVDEQNGLLWPVRDMLGGTSPQWHLPTLIALAIYFVLLDQLLFRGRFIVAMFLLAAAALIQLAIPMTGKAGARPADRFKVTTLVNFVTRMPDPGHGTDLINTFYRPVTMQLACNGADLGTSSRVISPGEFSSRVKPASQPPRQELISNYTTLMYHTPLTTQALAETPHLLLTALPFDPLRPEESNPRGKAKQDDSCFATQPYWWTFKYRGATALGSMNDTDTFPPSHDFPAAARVMLALPTLQPHADALLAVLRASDGRISSNWIRHALDYEDLLVPELCWRAQIDPALRPLLASLARAKYDMDRKLAAGDHAAILDQILSNIARSEIFFLPSLESVALDQLPPQAAPAVGRAWLRAMNATPSGFTNEPFTDQARVGDQKWLTCKTRPGLGDARLAALHHAAMRLRPANIFNRLVYEAALTKPAIRAITLIKLIGQFDRPEAVAVVRRLLESTANDRENDPFNHFTADRIKEIALEVRNPALEETFRDLIERTMEPSDTTAWGLEEFARSRIGLKGINQARLSQWIALSRRLDDGQKLKLLAAIEDAEAVSWAERLTASNAGNLKELLRCLNMEANPSYAQFLVKKFEDARGRMKRGASPGEQYELAETAGNALGALTAINTPQARDYVLRLWDEGPEGKKAVLNGLGRSVLRPGEQTLWLARLAGLPPELKPDACHALFNFRSSASYDLLQRWARTPPSTPDKRRIADSARAYLKTWREDFTKTLPPTDTAALAAERLRQGQALLAGKMQPDDLIAGRTPWVWRGTQYVPQP